MYARVTSGHVDPDQLDKFLDNARTSASPAARAHPGFQGGLVLADPQTGKFIGISLYQTQADCQAVEGSGLAGAIRSRTGSLLNLIWDESANYQVRFVDGPFQPVALDSDTAGNPPEPSAG